MLQRTERDRVAGQAYRAQLEAANGEYFVARRLHQPGQTESDPVARSGPGGVLFGYEGNPSWALVTATLPMTLASTARPVRVRVVVEPEAPGATPAGGLATQDASGTWSWGGSLPFDLADVRRVAVLVSDAAAASTTTPGATAGATAGATTAGAEVVVLEVRYDRSR